MTKGGQSLLVKNPEQVRVIMRSVGIGKLDTI